MNKSNKSHRHSIDLSNWMGNLGNIKRNAPITTLAIPGSHDSMTYSITRKSDIAPDTDWAKTSKYLRPFIKWIMYGWTVTQKVDATEQLHLGIRYFDLRIATKKNDPDLYIVHGLYGQNIKSCLKDINNFLNERPREVVILDFQHFYEFQTTNHEYLINLLITTFHDKLCTLPSDVSAITLDTMFSRRHQVIAVYRNSMYQLSNSLWPSDLLPTYWPDTMLVPNLLKFIEHVIANRPNNVCYVTQCILTPQKSTIIVYPFGGVKSVCAWPVLKRIVPRILKSSPPINVIIADFIELKGARFTRSVVDLNYS